MMSSSNSPTPSVDYDTNESRCDSATALNGELEEELVTVTLLKDTLKASDSEMPSPVEKVLEKGHEESKPVDYRGTMTRPLAFFGTFELQPETKKLPWISDHTSGQVHPDMHTISMLFNESLTLPEAAKTFVEQSLVLEEEARWERVKAVFYSFYPEDLRTQVFEILKEMLSRDASRIVAKKTLRFENEVILIPKPKRGVTPDGFDLGSDSDTETDLHRDTEIHHEKEIMSLNTQLSEITRQHNETIPSKLKDMKAARVAISHYDSFEKADVHAVQEGRISTEVYLNSCTWRLNSEALQESSRKCVEACLLSHHFDHAVARYEPRTGWIHVKTQLLRQVPEENKNIPKGLFGVKLFSEYKIKGTPEVQNAAISKQMECFEQGLRDNAKGHFLEYDMYHNIPDFHEFRFRLPYGSVSPKYCRTLLERHLRRSDGYYIACTPQILGYGMLHHEMKVYIKVGGSVSPCNSNSNFESSLEYVDRFGCCLNCFSKDHHEWECGKPKYGFCACVVKKK